MKYTLQLHGENRVYPVPEGLHELLADITREVLRAQPEQIVPFISDYLSALLITREAAKDAIKIVEDTLDSDLMKYCVKLKASPEKVLWATRIIQRALRRYFARKIVKLKKGSTGSHTFKKGEPLKYQTEEDLFILSSFLRMHNITYLQAHFAAIVIQRAWRGYHLRKTLKTKRPGLQQGIIVADEIEPELEKYAPGWANSWLTLFEKTEPPLSPFPKGKLYPVKRPSHVYLPRREISVNRHHLQTLFPTMETDDKICEQSSSRGASTPSVAFSPKPPIIPKADGESIHDESATDFADEIEGHFSCGEEEEYVLDHDFLSVYESRVTSGHFSHKSLSSHASGSHLGVNKSVLSENKMEGIPSKVFSFKMLTEETSGEVSPSEGDELIKDSLETDNEEFESEALVEEMH